MRDRQVPAVDRNSWSKKILEYVWEGAWHRERSVKLRRVKPSTAAWRDRKTRSEQVVLTRLRIGHTKITHGWLMEKGEVPMCQHCGTIITVEHLLIECRAFEKVRNEIGLENSLGEVLCYGQEREGKVIKFLKELKLFNQI